ncbi:hypothetical protein B566_EDAN005585 [Ephemera danica]|nr:hypothetical protein B566_EDAN005585 [Ephemera danica]
MMPETKTTVNGSGGHEEATAQTTEEEHDPHFVPIVYLPEVHVPTLEEHEDEMVKLKAKLFRFDNSCEPAEWKERGTGEIKLLRHRIQETVRVVMRRDKTLKICANHIGMFSAVGGEGDTSSESEQEEEEEEEDSGLGDKSEPSLQSASKEASELAKQLSKVTVQEVTGAGDAPTPTKSEEKFYPDPVLTQYREVSPLTERISSIFVEDPEIGYGTRTHTVILVDPAGQVDVVESTRDPGTSEWLLTRERFALQHSG